MQWYCFLWFLVKLVVTFEIDIYRSAYCIEAGLSAAGNLGARRSNFISSKTALGICNIQVRLSV